METYEKQALDIATQIVVAKASNSHSGFDQASGVDTANYFKAVYEGVREITESLKVK